MWKLALICSWAVLRLLAALNRSNVACCTILAIMLWQVALLTCENYGQVIFAYVVLSRNPPIIIPGQRQLILHWSMPF